MEVCGSAPCKVYCTLHQGRIDNFSVTDGLSGHFIRDIFEDREGSVWVSTEDGLDRFREFAAPTISVKPGSFNFRSYGAGSDARMEVFGLLRRMG